MKNAKWDRPPGLSMLLFFFAVALITMIAAAQETPSRSVWDGVYTDDQARRIRSQARSPPRCDR